MRPLESVFVKCAETITLPANLAAQVYFRVTNVSPSPIVLNAGDGIATVVFDDLGTNVETPYAGTFQKESQYSGMGAYGDTYAGAKG